jgi:hypothetical protein
MPIYVGRMRRHSDRRWSLALQSHDQSKKSVHVPKYFLNDGYILKRGYPGINDVLTRQTGQPDTKANVVRRKSIIVW